MYWVNRKFEAKKTYLAGKDTDHPHPNTKVLKFFLIKSNVMFQLHDVIHIHTYIYAAYSDCTLTVYLFNINYVHITIIFIMCKLKYNCMHTRITIHSTDYS
jgi:hypothetical protein